MPRRPKNRWVEKIPHITKFKPAGIPASELKHINLTVEELEAVRLKDKEGLDQEKCAKRMRISRPTFHRILISSRTKIAEALVEGKALLIEGGDFQVYERKFKCAACGHEFEMPLNASNCVFDITCKHCGSPEIHHATQKDCSFGTLKRGQKRHGSGGPGSNHLD